MKKILFSVGVCSMLLFLAACGSSGTQNGGGDLTGQVWGLTALLGQPLLSGTGISAQFTTDGKVSGSAGCNQYAGKYTTSGSSITFDPSIMSTAMACEQAVMDQEQVYLKMLVEAKTYKVKGDQLTFFGADNKVLAAYKAETQDLAGTDWNVVGYNNGKEAVVSVINGTTLTASFGKDGNLSGNAGCNNYNGSYTVNGNQITIGPLASTMMFCEEPAGTMDQEAQYLAALQTATTYQIENNTLELRTKEGALAANFSKK
jgi:heat shock protein HslJ